MALSETADEIIYCSVHPDREATLRCNKCGRPMCVQCAVQTPVGYRCRECVRGIQAKYYNANPYDEVIAFGVAAAAGGVIAYVLSEFSIPLFILLILSFPAGGAVSELIVRAVQKRRSRNMGYFGAAGAVSGGLVGAVLHAYVVFSRIWTAAQSRTTPGAAPFDVNLIFQIVMRDFGALLVIGIVAAAVYTRLRMRG
jgi:hypothetical protein